jgi:L-asparagine transporter-like permease
MVSLPASAYVPPGAFSAIWGADVGIDCLPTHGLLLETANSGLIGLSLWLVQALAQLRALRSLSRSKVTEIVRNWKPAYAMFVLAMVFWNVQTGLSPVWPVMRGIGWAACIHCYLRGRQERLSTTAARSVHLARPRIARPKIAVKLTA